MNAAATCSSCFTLEMTLICNKWQRSPRVAVLHAFLRAVPEGGMWLTKISFWYNSFLWHHTTFSLVGIKLVGKNRRAKAAESNRWIRSDRICGACSRVDRIFWNKIITVRSSGPREPSLEIRDRFDGWTCGQTDGRSWRAHNAYIKICKTHKKKMMLNVQTCALATICLLPWHKILY